MSAKRDLKILFTGWAMKKSNTIPAWHRRWFVFLNNCTIRYFVDKESVIEQGTIVIGKYTTAFVGSTIHEGCPLVIVNRDGAYTLALPSFDEACKWRDRIDEMKTMLQ